MDIRQREIEGIVILDLKGRLTVGGSATQVREKLRELIDGGARNVIFNLKECDYIDSTGLGTLVICYTSLQKAEGKLKLENLTRRNIELLILTKLETVFETYDNEQDAVNSFFPNREIKRFDILKFVQEQQED